MHTAAAQKFDNVIPGYLVAILWILRVVAAVILLQTLYFKFSGAPESVYIFTKVHAETWGRIGSGVIELFAAALLLWPRFTWGGALPAAGVMAGGGLSRTILRLTGGA